MRKTFKSCFLTTRDIGIEKYTVKEIAAKMKPVEIIHDENSLYEFAYSISNLLEVELPKMKKKPNDSLSDRFHDR